MSPEQVIVAEYNNWANETRLVGSKGRKAELTEQANKLQIQWQDKEPTVWSLILKEHRGCCGKNDPRGNKAEWEVDQVRGEELEWWQWR